MILVPHAGHLAIYVFTSGCKLKEKALIVSAKLSKSNVKWPFCMKIDAKGEITWPSGKYCIYKKNSCPSGKVQKADKRFSLLFLAFM